MNYELRRNKILLFTDLNAWKEGHKLVLMIYKATRHFPREEQFGLSAQLRRAAVSITSNIAEGFSRNSYREKVQFYSIALGSLTEVQNQLFVARDINYLNRPEFDEIFEQTTTVHKIINGLIKSSRTIIHNS